MTRLRTGRLFDRRIQSMVRSAAAATLACTLVAVASTLVAMPPARAQVAPDPPASPCTSFLGNWSGIWSQGFYGTQRIHVTHVSEQCVATMAYSPTEAPPQRTHQVPIEAGVMAFGCSVPGGRCRVEVKDAELRLTYTDPSGFVNSGVFRRDR